MTTSDVFIGLWKYFMKYDYPMVNSYIYNWESDFFCISKAGYAYEVEVKSSYSDFKADFNKSDKYEILEASKPFVKKIGWDLKHPIISNRRYGHGVKPLCDPCATSVAIIEPSKLKPNKFFYACPEDLISVDEIPEWAGLIYVTKREGDHLSIWRRYNAKIIKQPKFLHKVKSEKLKKVLLEKYMWSYKNKLNKEYFNFR